VTTQLQLINIIIIIISCKLQPSLVLKMYSMLSNAYDKTLYLDV